MQWFAINTKFLKMNIALVGSNFGLKGYLPALKIIKEFKIKIIFSRNINRLNLKKIRGVEYLSEWKKVFKKNIDIIISCTTKNTRRDFNL